ncbi:uncharacterized protein LOC105802594 isoform X1 [Gossypium raimondii]|uniref:Myeloid leukemia factor 1 n=1 Tax=Gossypium raimondii TaxID=29730 RepID=A0A0D2P5T3_GOSRA|nr:uncharacterized protein LOC105802594 isoform X1 [Gossypium raimondii]KJB41107.1 hypothetical protein B456_007G090800 [Gossypium raimondii]MBA0589568.1 hypothetical protein [Gossypium raimondii]
MQRRRESSKDLFDRGEPFDAFRRFGSFGSHNGMMSSLFGGKDPFDDPVFSRPFSSIFEPSIFDQSTTSREAPKGNGGKGIVIEELNSDGEEDKEKDEGNTEHDGSGKEPFVEHLDDSDNDGKILNLNIRNEYDKVKGSKAQAPNFSFQTSRVTYGGVDGTYYTSTRSRKTGSDGVVIEERKEADTTTGQATHRISRGIHDKGHSVTRKLSSDGKVDTTQTLHNLNEDELAEFEKAWEGNSQGHLTGWSDGFSAPAKAGSGTSEQMGVAVKDSWRLPYREQARNMGNQGANTEARTTSGGRTKKVVRINIE